MPNKEKKRKRVKKMGFSVKKAKLGRHLEKITCGVYKYNLYKKIVSRGLVDTLGLFLKPFKKSFPIEPFENRQKYLPSVYLLTKKNMLVK